MAYSEGYFVFLPKDGQMGQKWKTKSLLLVFSVKNREMVFYVMNNIKKTHVFHRIIPQNDYFYGYIT